MERLTSSILRGCSSTCPHDRLGWRDSPCHTKCDRINYTLGSSFARSWLSCLFCSLAWVARKSGLSVASRKLKAQAKPPVPGKLEFIVGKRTQKIKNAAPELQKGGAIEATTKITAKDPITLQGNAYVTIIGRTALLNIQHAMDLYHAEHDRYPKNYDEFMSEIIKADQISLPQLPYYQKYGYDEKEHKLVILEYPDLKNQPLPQ